jgi:uncharacterized membrane protein
MTAGIGLPLIMTRFGGNVTILAAVGLLPGYAVIKAPIDTLIMYTFVYRR